MRIMLYIIETKGLTQNHVNSLPYFYELFLLKTLRPHTNMGF